MRLATCNSGPYYTRLINIKFPPANLGAYDYIWTYCWNPSLAYDTPCTWQKITLVAKHSPVLWSKEEWLEILMKTGFYFLVKGMHMPYLLLLLGTWHHSILVYAKCWHGENDWSVTFDWESKRLGLLVPIKLRWGAHGQIRLHWRIIKGVNDTRWNYRWDLNIFRIWATNVIAENLFPISP